MLNQLLQETKSQVKEGQNWVISPLGFEILFKLLIPMIHGKTKEELINLVGEESALILLDQLELEKHNGEDGKKQFDFDQSFQYAKHLGLDFKNVEEYQKNYEKYLPHLRWNYQDIDDPSSRIDFVIINELRFAHKWWGFEDMDGGIVFQDQDGKEYRIKSFSRESGVDFNPKYYRDEELEAVQIDLGEDFKTDFYVEFYKPKNLIHFLEQLDEKKIETYQENFQEVALMEVIIPEFDIEHELNIDKNKNELGLRSLFQWSHDLSFLLGTKNRARVNKCYQEAVIEFNKLGIKGYAKTALEGIIGIFSPDEMRHILFELDRPFFFLIKHKSGKVLFLGTYQVPKSTHLIESDEETLKYAVDAKLIRQFKTILVHFGREEKIYLTLSFINSYLTNKKLIRFFWVKEILRDIYTYLQEPTQELLDKIAQCHFYSELTGFEVNNIYFEPRIGLKYHTKEQWLCNSLAEIIRLLRYDFGDYEYDNNIREEYWLNRQLIATLEERIIEPNSELLQKDFSNKNILQEFKNIQKLIA